MPVIMTQAHSPSGTSFIYPPPGTAGRERLWLLLSPGTPHPVHSERCCIHVGCVVVIFACFDAAAVALQGVVSV